MCPSWAGTAYGIFTRVFNDSFIPDYLLTCVCTFVGCLQTHKACSYHLFSITKEWHHRLQAAQEAMTYRVGNMEVLLHMGLHMEWVLSIRYYFRLSCSSFLKVGDEDDAICPICCDPLKDGRISTLDCSHKWDKICWPIMFSYPLTLTYDNHPFIIVKAVCSHCRQGT